MNNMELCEKILFSGEEIEKRCSEIAKQIYQDVKGNAVTSQWLIHVYIRAFEKIRG